MSDTQTILAELLNDSQAKPTEKWVENVLSEHPTFTLAAALMLNRTPHQELPPALCKRLQALTVLGSSDPMAMSDLALTEWAQFYPPEQEKKENTTIDTIDSFLSTYCQDSSEDDALIEKLIFNPVAADYMQSIEPETPQEEEQKLPVDAVVDNGGDEEVPGRQEGHDEPLLMESLAKIYIKQRRYERAFEIINNLSLKFPEKSVYFADQLRFLQKLILIKQTKAKKEALAAQDANKNK